MKPKESAQIRRALTLKCAKAGIPVSGNFELTPRCNLGCKMCYVRLTPEEMAGIGREKTAKEWLEMAGQAKEEGMLFLLITGGEPTLRSDFKEIYEGLAKMGLSISINSNGTMLDKELRQLFTHYPPSQMNITLYGLSGKEYQDMCGNEKAYHNMVDALTWLKQIGILTHLNATMVPANIDQWEAYAAFAKEQQMELRTTAYCFPPVRRDCKEFVRLDPETAGRLSAKDLLYHRGLDTVKKYAQTLQPPMEECRLDEGNPMQCMAGRSQFWIKWDGSMVPCGMLNSPTTYPFEEGFAKAWAQLKEGTEAIRLCAECVNCPDRKSCMNCAAVTYTETGRFDGKPEYACRMNRAYQQALKEYAGIL